MDMLLSLLDNSLSRSRLEVKRVGDGEEMGAPAITMASSFLSASRLGEGMEIGEEPAVDRCANCGMKREDLCSCPCFHVAYCSTECQLAHWSEHKQVCKHGRGSRYLTLSMCHNCSQKSYTLRQCPCRNAFYCNRGCQMDDWSRHEITCTGLGDFKSEVAKARSCGVDAAVQTENMASDSDIGPLGKASPKRGMNVHFAHLSLGVTDEDDGNHPDGDAGAIPSSSLGASSNTTCPLWRPAEALRGPWKGFTDVATQQAGRNALHEVSFLDFARVDCESEESTLQDRSVSNGESSALRDDGSACRRATGDTQRSVVLGGDIIHHNPLDPPVAENPLIAVPIRTTFDTLPGLASYLANQNKDSGIVVVLASFANFIAEEIAARRLISSESKRERVGLMRRFELGWVRITLLEMSELEERDRKSILADTIVWRRKVAYPAYQELRKMLKMQYCKSP